MAAIVICGGGLALVLVCIIYLIIHIVEGF